MKILGEKSLSSKAIVGLKAFFAIISIVDVIVLSLIAKTIKHITAQQNIQGNIFDLNLFIMIMITGIIALLIIYQFIKIFQNIKNNILFSQENSERLNTVSNSCLLISAIYCIITILVFFIMKNYADEFIHFAFAFSIMLTVVLCVFGIGLKILNEIYKKAIEYKEENDFII